MQTGNEHGARAGAGQDAPLRLSLALSRVNQPDDPYAFQFAAQTYLVRAGDSGLAAAEWTWDRELLSDLETLRLRPWEIEPPQRVGERLRRFLAGTGWALEEHRLIDAVHRRQPVVLTVSSTAAELYALPWELVSHRATGQHIGELPDVVLRYEWPDTQTIRERPVERGRILLAWSAAAGAVPAAEHIAAIAGACAGTQYPFDRERDVLAHVSCESLVAALHEADARRSPISVLHLLCHGAEVGPTFGLALSSNSPDETVTVVDGPRLRQLLAPFASTLRLVVISACDGGNVGALGNQLGSVAQTLHRAGLRSVLASRFPLSIHGAKRLAHELYGALLLRHETLETAVVNVRDRLARSARQLDWLAIQFYARAADGDVTRPLFVRPFRGLQPFRPEYRWAFFGRDVEIAELHAQILGLIDRREPRFVVVAGATGVGKTSLIQAGLVPALRAEPSPRWRTLELRPGAAPIAEFTAAVAGLTGGPVEPTPEGIWAALQAWQAAEPDCALLLTIDPLEELFLQTAEPAQRTTFMRLLWDIARTSSLVAVVVAALRIDFVGRCGEIDLSGDGTLRLDQIAYNGRHRVFLPQFGATQLRAAIEGPARAVALDLDPGLVERIVADFSELSGVLPLFQQTLTLLWLQRTSRRLTLAAYEAIGGIGGALERHAEEVLAKMTPPQLQQARRTLVLLAAATCAEGGVELRRQIPLARLRPGDPREVEPQQQAIELLLRARLIVYSEQTRTNGEEKQIRIELAHETLLHRWRRLREWVHEDRSRVVELRKIDLWVHEWQEYGSLLDELRLGYALEVSRRNQSDLSAEAHELIDRSKAKVEAVRLAEQRRITELEAMLAATQDLITASDEDMTRAEAELVQLRRWLRLALLVAGAALGAVFGLLLVLLFRGGPAIAV